jgi:hypothetical protein
MSQHRICKLLFAVVISVAFGATAFGQTAQITGRISDQGGAVIQSAKVTVTNEGNGFKRETSSNDEGYFTVPSLLPGRTRFRFRKRASSRSCKPVWCCRWSRSPASTSHYKPAR